MTLSRENFSNLSASAVVFVAQFPASIEREKLESLGRNAILKTQKDLMVHETEPSDRPKLDAEDGSWSLKWASGQKQLSFDLEKSLVGASFIGYETPDKCVDLAIKHAKSAIKEFEVEWLHLLNIRFRNVFLLTDETITNHELLLPKLLKIDQSAINSIIKDPEKINRFDINLSYELTDNCFANIQVEMPFNRDKRSVWFELAVQTQGNTSDTDPSKLLEEVVETTLNFYKKEYSDLVCSVLDDSDVELYESN